VKPSCGFASQCDFRSINPIYARVAARGAPSCGDCAAGKKAQFHEPAGEVFGQVDVLEDRFLTRAQIGKAVRNVRMRLLETQLQHIISMRS